jgi:hypothetical protein
VRITQDKGTSELAISKRNKTASALLILQIGDGNRDIKKLSSTHD